MIVIWRMLAKSFFHFVLPPTFRFLSHLFTLPNRRFYTPATDYTSMPADKGLRPIPSVIDLPGMVEYEVDGVGAAATASTARRGYGVIKQRAGKNGSSAPSGKPPGQEPFLSEKSAKGVDARDAQEWWAEPRGKDEQAVKHYDADGEYLRSRSRTSSLL